MNTSSLLLHPRRLGSLLGFSVIALGALSPARADFIPTNAGPHDYNTVTNWDSDTINGVFSKTLTATQAVTFGADTALSTGLAFQYGGAFNMTLRGTGAARTITLGGDISLDSVADGRTVTLGSTTVGQELNITLGASRSISVAGTDTLKLLNVVSGNTGIDITKTGAGTLALDGNNAGNFQGSININAGTVTNNGTFQAAFGTGVINLGATSGSADATLRGGGNKAYNTAINIRAGSTGTLTIGHYAGLGQNGTATFSGALKIDNNFTVDGGGVGVIVSGAVSSATGGTFELTKTGAGVVTWGKDTGNDYSNLTLNIDVTAGTLRAGGGSGTNAFDTKGVVTVSSGATFDVFNKRPSIGALVGAGTVTQSTSTSTTSLTLNGVSDAVFTGTLADGSTGGYNVIKTGSAKQTL
ncbi:MAG TPA: hypothetical protein VIO38_00700, partial [Rariglobus sp.]